LTRCYANFSFVLLELFSISLSASKNSGGIQNLRPLVRLFIGNLFLINMEVKSPFDDGVLMNLKNLIG
jgi:hypothetical protein